MARPTEEEWYITAKEWNDARVDWMKATNRLHIESPSKAVIERFEKAINQLLALVRRPRG